MKINTPALRTPLFTHEGGPAKHIDAMAQLRRTVLSCMLWEKEFYEDGQTIADRVKALVPLCKPTDVAALALHTRTEGKLRHVPLLMLRELARHPQLEPKTLSTAMAATIQRADELAEFLAIYWKDGKQPLSKQVKRGLAWALRRFSEYDLAKYNRDSAVTLRDVMFLTHAKPKDAEQGELWKRLAENSLATPDTWEVALSAGVDKKATFERLIVEHKLGYLALLRNLRNMEQAGCDPALVKQAILARRGAERVLPFRFLSAAKHAQRFEPELDFAMQAALADMPKLAGETIVLVDNSGSMVGERLAGKSDLTRQDAATGLAILAAGIAESCRVFSFSDRVTEVPPRKGMALRDAILKTPSGGTALGACVKAVSELPHDRLIVLTDEQSHDRVPDPVKRGYMINVASNKNGVGYGKWLHIDGFSEAVLKFVAAYETDSQS